MNKIKNYINNIAFLIDASGSMQGLSDNVVTIFDNQIKYLAQRSRELDQETRVSVYCFNETTTNLAFNIDVLRLPSLKGLYRAQGNTALVNSTIKVISDMKQIPELYGDSAFLIYVITDGEENQGGNPKEITSLIGSLNENWTIAALVPNANAFFEAKKFGFPSQNTQIWETSTKGIVEMGESLRKTTENYMIGRSKGIRGTKTLFKLDVSNIDTNKVKQSLVQLLPNEYIQLAVNKDSVIKNFIESWKIPFVPGANYYQLTKTETLQYYKQIIVQDKVTGKTFSGVGARNLLGLPNTEVKVVPDNYGTFDIFCQSSSNNRKLIAGTKLIILT